MSVCSFISVFQMIKLFELAEQSDIVINLAELAINVAEKTEHPDLVRLIIY